MMEGKSKLTKSVDDNDLEGRANNLEDKVTI